VEGTNYISLPNCVTINDGGGGGTGAGGGGTSGGNTGSTPTPNWPTNTIGTNALENGVYQVGQGQLIQVTGDGLFRLLQVAQAETNLLSQFPTNIARENTQQGVSNVMAGLLTNDNARLRSETNSNAWRDATNQLGGVTAYYNGWSNTIFGSAAGTGQTNFLGQLGTPATPTNTTGLLMQSTRAYGVLPQVSFDMRPESFGGFFAYVRKVSGLAFTIFFALQAYSLISDKMKLVGSLPPWPVFGIQRNVPGVNTAVASAFVLIVGTLIIFWITVTFGFISSNIFGAGSYGDSIGSLLGLGALDPAGEAATPIGDGIRWGWLYFNQLFPVAYIMGLSFGYCVAWGVSDFIWMAVCMAAKALVA